MRCEPWMNHDERTPEQRRQDRLHNLRYEKSELLRRLSALRKNIKELETAELAD